MATRSRVVLHQVQVLVDGVRRAAVPLGAQLLVEVHLRGRQSDEVIVEERAEAPVALDVLGRADCALNCVST